MPQTHPTPHGTKLVPWAIFTALTAPVLLIAYLSYHQIHHWTFYGMVLLLNGAIALFILRRLQDTESLRRHEETEHAGDSLLLQRAQHQLVQQERLRALGQMAGGIAHDFNNALAPILGYSELMLDMSDILEDREKSIEYLQMINTAAKDAANIVRRLREFYRPREKNESFASVDLNYLVQQTVILTQPRWKTQALQKGIDIKIEMDLEKVPFIDGNEAELREAFTNFIFNAVDAMPQGGNLFLHTTTRNGKVALEIRDTGMGMSEETRQRCFEPFFTTKGEQGTGLGLAMAYGIIQRHGGHIEIHSEMEKGTTFFIYLPVKQESKAPIPLGLDPRFSRPLKILYVEDEGNVREVIVEYLKRDGHEVEQAADGMEGLRKFLLGHYDLVITDKAMPGMTGIQLAGAIKKRTPEKPVILLSGTEAEEGLQGIIDAVVGKPLTLEELRRAIFELSFKTPLHKVPGFS